MARLRLQRQRFWLAVSATVATPAPTFRTSASAAVLRLAPRLSTVTLVHTASAAILVITSTAANIAPIYQRSNIRPARRQGRGSARRRCRPGPLFPLHRSSSLRGPARTPTPPARDAAAAAGNYRSAGPSRPGPGLAGGGAVLGGGAGWGGRRGRGRRIALGFVGDPLVISFFAIGHEV
jgi:hypothetical protein